LSVSWWKTLEQRFRLRTFVTTMVPTMGALGLQLITFALTARGLGVEQFGLYTALVAIVGVATELVGLGGADLLVRAVAIQRDRFGAYFGNMLVWMALSLPFVLFGSMCLAIGPMRMQMDLWHVGLALVAEIMMARTLASVELVMVAHQHTARAGWLRLVTFGTRLVLAFVVFVVLEQQALSVWIEAIFVQSLLVTASLIALTCWVYGRPEWRMRWAEAGQGATFALNQTSRAMQSNMDRMILSRYADAAALGAYGAATRIVQLGMFPVQVVTRMLYPKFFVHGANGIHAVRGFAVKTAAPALAGVGIMSGLVVAVAGQLAPWVLGAEYAASVETTMQLAWALPFIALQYPAADALTASGRQWMRTIIATSSTLLFGFLLVAGAYLWGARGVTSAYVAGHVVVAAVMWLTVWRCSDVKQG
jgi:O-antigen/teichoic acid export membrane protein